MNIAIHAGGSFASKLLPDLPRVDRSVTAKSDFPSLAFTSSMLRAAVLYLCSAACAWSQTAPAPAAPRKLISVSAPQHDPLFIDADSVQRRGDQIHFKYLLDVLAPDDNGVPGVWKSNEIEASIDCTKRLVTVRKLVAYAGRRGSGNATAVHTFTTPGTKPEPVTPKSTFAYLEAQLCPAR